tara:strand:- start:172 stop:441 length:270 start_codon:yes stop_codon:yes gene_type:complete
METVLEYIAGPTGGMVVAALVLYGGYKLAVSHLIPLAKSWIDKHFEHIDELMDEHKKDREVFQEAILHLTGRLDKIEGDVESIKEKLDG